MIDDRTIAGYTVDKKAVPWRNLRSVQQASRLQLNASSLRICPKQVLPVIPQVEPTAVELGVIVWVRKDFVLKLQLCEFIPLRLGKSPLESRRLAQSPRANPHEFRLCFFFWVNPRVPRDYQDIT